MSNNYCAPSPLTLTEIHGQAWELICRAEEAGVIVTIETQPSQPLSMGWHLMHASVRPARICQPRPERLDLDEMVWIANCRLKRMINERHAFESAEVRKEFDNAAGWADFRTLMAALLSMDSLGVRWHVPAFAYRGGAKS